MFLILLGVTFALALTVSLITAKAFSKPINNILNRIIADDISLAWVKYLKFAIVVTGISTGVRLYDLERYIGSQNGDSDSRILDLTYERWALEIYRTIIETLQGIAWLLLIFFAFAMVAYVIVRIAEVRNRSNS